MITFVRCVTERVYLDDKLVGIIEQNESGGFQYVPRGFRKVKGDVFATLVECKNSLIGETNASDN